MKPRRHLHEWNVKRKNIPKSVKYFSPGSVHLVQYISHYVIFITLHTFFTILLTQWYVLAKLTCFIPYNMCHFSYIYMQYSMPHELICRLHSLEIFLWFSSAGAYILYVVLVFTYNNYKCQFRVNTKQIASK